MRAALVLVLCTVIAPWTAMAQQARRLISQAAEAVEDAERDARRARGQCRAAVGSALDVATDHVYDLRRTTRPRDVQVVKLELEAVSQNAAVAGCPPGVSEGISRALEILEDVRVQLFRERRDDDDDDDGSGRDDERWGRGYAQLSPLTVNVSARFDGEPAVQVAVPELRAMNLTGRTFYLGARFRSVEGQWSEWTTTQAWAVPRDPFVWRAPFNHFFPYSALAEDDFSDGRFIATVAVFDGESGRVLASRDARFQVRRLPRLPPPPVRPPPVIGVPPGGVRDCGTGRDVGCAVARDGQFPLDAVGFSRLVQALRASPGEAARAQTAQVALSRSYLTALQFGLVLDMFTDELTRLAVAQAGVLHIVNPQHAVAYSAKWTNPSMAAQYTQLILGGQPMPPGPVRPGVPPPPVPGQPPPPGFGVRDCGTGNDPGCGVARNGQWAMDGVTFQGVVTALNANDSEFVRADILKAAVERNFLTAAQLSVFLDMFTSEFTRMDIARLAAPRVVDPRAAVALSAKFNSTFNSREFAQLMLSQP